MKYFINLFPEKEKDAVDKVMYFAFHYLRYILVITQFVVICVFFFRFKVDQEIVDLKDRLSQKKQIIVATKSLINEIAYLEEKSNSIAAIAKDEESFQTMINYFIDGLPSDILLTSLAVTTTKIVTEGYSVNPASIQKYREQIDTEGKFEKVTLSSVRKSDVGFSFLLTLDNYKNE
jgi:cell division protein FtsL